MTFIRKVSFEKVVRVISIKVSHLILKLAVFQKKITLVNQSEPLML